MDVHGIFHELVSDLEQSMFIVTARDGDHQAGCLVGFATQCSIKPPRFLVCLSSKNRTYRLARRASHLAVHFVPREAVTLAELFGGRSGEDVDKFRRCSWQPGPVGLPILQECGNWFVGRVVERLDLGDHVGFLLDPVEAQRNYHGRYFDFHQAQRIPPGQPI